MKATKETTTRPSPIKVCMHVLASARTDVRVMREATALKEQGFAVYIVDTEDNHHQPVEEEIGGISISHIILRNSLFSEKLNQWVLHKVVEVFLRSVLRLIRTPADIYHAHDVPALFQCAIAALLHRKPLVFDAHELPLTGSSSGLLAIVKRLAAWLLARILLHCVGVITVSSPIAEILRTRYHARNVSLVRNVLGFQVIPRSVCLRQYLGLPSEVAIALYQGFFLPNRGIDKLVRAAAFLNQNIVIVLMGSGFGETQAQLEALISNEGVSDRIKIIPPVSYTELLDWTASADIGLIVYPPDSSLNVQFCLPNKLFEYLMVGLPVLASRLDAVSEVIKTYDVGQIVYSLTPEDISAAINAMFADPVNLARMRRNALEASRHELCWEKEKSQLIHLYHDILKLPNTELAKQKIFSHNSTHSN